jgi:solute:Na+ symporter, SSS family
MNTLLLGMSGAVAIDVFVFVAFVAAVIAIGIWKSRDEKDSESYFLAGRGLSWWLIGFSLIAANISTEQFVGMSGQAATNGLGLAIASYEWIAAITLVVVAFTFLPKFLRSGVYTIPEFLEYRFNHAARMLMSISMVAIFVFVTITAVIYSGAKFFDPIIQPGTDNISLLAWCIGLLAAVYVAVGGLKACAWADLIQGSALIIGGVIVMFLAFGALDQADPETLGLVEQVEMEAAEPVPEGEGEEAVVTDEISDAVEPNPVVLETDGEAADAEEEPFDPEEWEATGVVTKFRTLNADNLHMSLPFDNAVIPWTALLFAIWIPNFYYWGLNQYIMQRTLGAGSLAEGQKGIVFAAGLKLIIPFIVCVPGIMAFNLYRADLQSEATSGTNKDALAAFDKHVEAPVESKMAFEFNDDFAQLNTEKAEGLVTFNATVAGVPADADVDVLAALLGAGVEVEHVAALIEADVAPEMVAPLIEAGAGADLVAVNGRLIEVIEAGNKDLEKKDRVKVQTELVGYDYDSTFGILVGKLVSRGGLLGFILAALFGAVMSSLASMLNAASTIFTMDIYKQHINKEASQTNLVWVGRACVILFVCIGCAIAPMLANPQFKGLFNYIQEFQGFISPGILTIFLFGLFVPKTPRVCGLVGLFLSPVIYGLLFIFANDMAFLNRMAITVVSLIGLLGIITIAAPLKEPIKMPEQSKLDMKSSKGAAMIGIVVCILTAILYVIFW